MKDSQASVDQAQKALARLAEHLDQFYALAGDCGYSVDGEVQGIVNSLRFRILEGDRAREQLKSLRAVEVAEIRPVEVVPPGLRESLQLIENIASTTPSGDPGDPWNRLTIIAVRVAKLAARLPS